jgi:putative hydrolase of the HAD superfamily
LNLERNRIAQIDGVIFDLFGTLTGAEVDRDRHIVALAKSLGAPAHEFRAALRDSFDGRARGQYGDLRQTLLSICDELNLVVRPTAINRAIELRMASERRMLQPRKGAIELLTELRNQGFKIGLLSDCTPEIIDIWPDLPYADLIDCAVRSCDVGWRKPDARMYWAVLQGLGLDPTTCMYIGDGGSSELTGAAAVGLRPVLLRAPGETYHRYDAESDWDGEAIEGLEHVLGLLRQG